MSAATRGQRGGPAPLQPRLPKLPKPLRQRQGPPGKRQVGSMWKYVKRYLLLAVLAGLFMMGEVLMDLVQPGIMSRIVDDGVLGMNGDGLGDLSLVWTLGLQMIGLVLFGGLCGSMNNVFVHLSGAWSAACF